MTPENTNRHHILHYEKYWGADRCNKELRQSMGMIALMDIQTHDELHLACPAPPPLDIYMSQHVLSMYHPNQDPFKAIDSFRLAVDEAIKHPRTRDIERSIGLLAIEAVTMQIPYLKEGLILPDRKIAAVRY